MIEIPDDEFNTEDIFFLNGKKEVILNTYKDTLLYTVNYETGDLTLEQRIDGKGYRGSFGQIYESRYLFAVKKMQQARTL